MKYKNITEKILKFRANDLKGVKRVFELKPNEEMESDRRVSFGGLEKIKEVKKEKIEIKKSNLKEDE